MPLSATLLAVWIGATPHVLVLTDGSAVRTRDVPARSGELVVVRLEDGTLVSLPDERVDWNATARMNDDERVAADDSAPESVARSRRAQRRARVGRHVNNETIGTFSEANPVGQVPPADGTAAITEERGPSGTLLPVVPSITLDDEGRGPDFWRERARGVRDRLRRAQLAERAARRSLESEREALVGGRRVPSSDRTFEVVHYIQSDEERAVAMLRISELEERWREADSLLLEARADERELREEARRAGAKPGWLRLPVAY